MPFIDVLARRRRGGLAAPGLAVLIALAGCTGSSQRGPGEVSKPVPPTAAPKLRSTRSSTCNRWGTPRPSLPPPRT